MTAQIIEFRSRAWKQEEPESSNAFENMKGLFEVCDKIEACNFYLESVETLAGMGSITEREKFTLRRIGRQKRIALAHPVQKPAEVATAPGEYMYTPEMGQAKPKCEIEASLSYYGKHYHLRTRLDLKGRGIELNETRPDGVKWYTVTIKAYEKIKATHTVSYECALD